MSLRPLRLLAALSWLLTPVAAWAASFLGAWGGARATGTMAGLVVGGVVGALLGTVGWLVVARRLIRKYVSA